MYFIKSTDTDRLSLLKVQHDNTIRTVGTSNNRDDLLALITTEKGGDCGCNGECECNRVFRSAAYAKYVNTEKCGCGGGKLITIDDLKRKKKKK